MVPLTRSHGLLLAAQGYAERGWLVLPLWWPFSDGACACGRRDCSKPGKHPLTRHGLHDATTDPGVIGRWWTRWPQANVGIRTGTTSRLLVVDVDGPSGMASLRRLRGEYGPLPAAWVRTGSGGWHAYLRQPDGQRIPNSVGRLGPGLDIRADGGSIVAPPSLHAAGGRYGWLKPGVDPPPAPEWLIRMALPPPPPPVPALTELAWQVSGRYAEAAIRREAEAVAAAPAGTRNYRLNIAAYRLGRLVAGGVADEASAREALLAAAALAGLPHHESAGTVGSGMRAGMRSPRVPRSGPAGAPITAPVSAAPRRPLRGGRC